MKNSVYKSILKTLTLFSAFLFLLSSVYAAGVIDRSFGTNGKVLTNNPMFTRALIVQPDGKFIVADTNVYTLSLARFNQNGSPDASFGVDGTTSINILFPSARAIELQSDGKIVVVGSVAVNPSPGASDFLIVRFNSNGSLDSTFGSGGIVSVNQGTYDYFNAAAIQPDGKIVAAGSTSDGGNRGAIIRFNSNGTIDTTFADFGLYFFTFTATSTVTSAGFSDIKVLPDGRILTGATYLRNSANPPDYFQGYFLIMLNAQGGIYNDFGTQGISGSGRQRREYGEGLNFEILPNGKIFVASLAGVVVLNQNGSIYKHLPFEGATTTMFPDGRVLVSGDSNSFNTQIGYMKLYSGENFIGKAANIPYGLISPLPNGKIIVVSSEGGFLTLRRLNLITSFATRIADFNRDDKTDFGAFQPSAGTTAFKFLNSDGSQFNLSLLTTKIIPEYSEYIDPEFFLRRSSVISWRRGIANIPTNSRYSETGQNGDRVVDKEWGLEEDIPTGGDFNGDAITDMTVFRPSTGVWYAMRSDNGTYSIARWGASGDKPVPADYDYDGKTDYAVYRPSTGTWWIYRSSDGGSFAVKFGIATDIPLTGDFDADGKADFTVYRPSEGNWYQLLTTEGFRVVRFGLAADIPVPGDYDGDGRHDPAVFRNGLWYLLQSSEGFKTVQFGETNDLPIAVRYDQ